MPFFNKKSELEKNYKVGETLGSGNFAVVKKAQPRATKDELLKSGIPVDVAVKVIDKSKVEDIGDIEREIAIMNNMDHPNIIKLFEIFDEKRKINLVMELVTGGELFDAIVARGNYTEKDAATCMAQLCGALQYLHAKGIVHRDLKPENLLLNSPTDATIKVADFGLSRVISSGDVMKTACGTPGYVAPEVLKNKGYDSGAVDMWSAGVILYILLCGFPPFFEEELPALFEQIMKGRYDFPSPWWDNISDGSKNLVRRLLTVDPKERMSATEALGNGWILCDASADRSLASSKDALKKYNLTRKFQKAARGIKAAQRLNKALDGLAK